MRPMAMTRLLVAALLSGGILAACGGGGGGDDDDGGGPTVISGTGAIQDEVDAYRAALGGTDNGGTPGGHADGRREINWDAVPDEQAAPNFLPSDFFNAPAAHST